MGKHAGVFVREDRPWCANETGRRLREALRGVITHMHTFNRQQDVPRDTSVGFCEKEMILQHRRRRNHFLSRGTHTPSEHRNDPEMLICCSGRRRLRQVREGALLCLGEISDSTEIRRG